MSCGILDSLQKFGEKLDEKPFLLVGSLTKEQISNDAKESIKELYELMSSIKKNNKNKQGQIYVDGFSEEQIWAQIKRKNDQVLPIAENLVQKLVVDLPDHDEEKEDEESSDENDESFTKIQEEEEDEGDDISNEENANNEYDEDEEEEEDEDEDEDEDNINGNDDDEISKEDNIEDDDNRQNNKNFGNGLEYTKKNPENINDEMENLQRFLDQAENMDIEQSEKDEDEENLEDEMNEDYDMSDISEDSERLTTKKKKVRVLAEHDDDEEKEENEEKEQDKIGDDNDDMLEDAIFDDQRENKLLFEDDDEKNQDDNVNIQIDSNQLKDEITNLENRLLEKKSWQTQGEIKAGQRPLNSLLQETLDFNANKKAPTVITPEFTGNLESMIKQRILDEAWDDPIKYVMPKAIKENFNRLEDINFEKNTAGLADVYENEYKKTIMGIDDDKQDETIKEIELLYKKLSYNLDVLSNLNFTPKPYLETAKISTNTASIKLEEKTPIFISEKQQLAPQELLKPNEINLKSEEDMTSQDKKAQHRNLKRLNRNKLKEKLKKKMIKELQFKGETKYQRNIIRKGITKYNKSIQDKNQTSIKFTKSSQFFENLEKNKNNLNKPKINEEKAIKKKKNYKL